MNLSSTSEYKQSKLSIMDYVPMISAVLIWGAMGLPAYYAVQEIGPVTLLASRAFIATLVLLPFALKEGRLLAEPGDRFFAVASGLAGVFFNSFFYFYAVKHTSITNNSIIFATVPLLTALLGCVFLGEKLTLRRCLGIVIAMGGVLFLLTGGNLAQLFSMSLNRGDLSEFLAACTSAIMAILGRKIKHSSPTVVTLNGMFASFVLSVPCVYLSGETIPTSLSLSAWGGVLYLGILSTAVACALQQKSIQKIGASSSAAFLNGTPAIGILVAFFLLGESVSLVQIISTAIIFSGIFLNAGSAEANK